MACPFFVPVRPMDDESGSGDAGPWLIPPRLPLGEAFHGFCHATPGTPFEPPETEQRELCNCGYVRGRCGHFPADGAADAVRFSARSKGKARLEIVYILEKGIARRRSMGCSNT